MKETGIITKKGKRRGRVLALVLALTMLMAGASLFTASAAPNGTFTVSQPGEVTKTVTSGGFIYYPPYYYNVTIYDAEAKFSTSQQVNLKNEEVFQATRANGVKRFTITMDGVYNSGAIQAAVDTSSKLEVKESGKITTVTATSKQGFTVSDINSALSCISLSFNQNSGKRTANAKITIKGYNSATNAQDSASLIGWTYYTTNVVFYTYAEGSLNDDTLQVGYTSASQDQSAVEPDDTGRGKATFDVDITDQGGGSFLQVGYMIKKATDTWTGNTIAGLSEKYTVGDPALDKPIPVTVEGFDYNTDYDVKAVVVTDGDTDAAKETESIRVRYDKPTVNAFNIGDVSASYTGGDVKTITTAVSFPNTNYEEPKLELSLFFTSKLTQTDGKDSSVWTQVGNTESFNLTDNESKIVNKEFKHELPSDVDGKDCAYKLVASDPQIDYDVYQFSSTFLLDSYAPTEPKVSSTVDGDKNLADGTSLVGGANATAELKIGGSTDSASGIKGYEYSMYYLGTDQGDAFAQHFNKALTMESILLTMKDKLTGPSVYPGAEFTDWTSLPQADGENLTSLSVSKDGYYYVLTRAVDNVGKYSAEHKSIFRVDLTAPNPPEIRMAQPKADNTPPVNGGSVSAALFEAYDGRTYSDKEVWLFAKSIPLTGKKILTDEYEYSLDGGLSWKKVKAESTYVSKAGTLPDVYKSDYSAKESFAYDVGFKLSSREVQGYQSVIMRATDTLGNVSLSSDPAVMRQSESITVTGSLSHENVEVALAMGNTEMTDTGSISPKLKNLTAKKINENYFGTVDTAKITQNPEAAGFNPLEMLYTKVNGVWTLHQCTWDKGGSSCDQDTACPYLKYGDEYEYYTPDMINVQGITSANPGTDKSFTWVRYDHTMYKKYATVSFDTKKDSADGTKVLHTTLRPDTSSATYLTSKTNGEVRYTASLDRVAYTGQTKPYDTVEEVKAAAENDTNTGGTNSILNAYVYQWYGTAPVHGWSTYAGYVDTETSIGKYVEYAASDYGSTAGAYGVARRIYHMIDMSNSHEETATYNPNYPDQTYTVGDITDPDKLDMSTIYAMGYQYGSMRDWLFLYNDQPTKKEISFTIDDARVYAHSNDGYGFLFNTTIRQNIAGDWVISGYMFGIGNPTTGQSIANYKWYILTLEDVNLEWFASGALKKDGVYAGPARSTSTNNMDELFLYLIKSDNSGWTSADGKQKIQVKAYSDPDTTSVSIRNFRLITEGTNTMLYLYNSQKTSYTAQELDTKYDSDMKAAGGQAASYAEGYKLVQWTEKETGNVLTTLVTPRPTVDGCTIGDLSGLTEEQDETDIPHSDTNCYGFGPLTSAKSYGHGCKRDSLVIFSNISMKMNKARKLTEVITEPKWGGGKAKYILNISDDSVKDFTDPVQASQVEWRISTDSAKLIGWGSVRNKKVTENFITNNIEGKGMYQSTLGTTQEAQMENIATYISNTYYEAFGLDPEGNVTEQVQSMADSKGSVYTLEDIKKMTFAVTPSDYNDTTANEDYPSGRWYIVHDVKGYPNAIKSSRSGQYSDALNLQITEPGRYTVYFAPDAAAVKSGLLDPSDKSCIFDFVVDQPPQAQLVGTYDTNSKITIQDYSIDPDTQLTPDKPVITDAEAANPTQQISGISKTMWRWELRVPYKDPVTKKDSVLIAMSQEDWQDSSVLGNKNPYNGKTITQLTQGVGKLTAEGMAKIVNASPADRVASGMDKYVPVNSSGKYYYNAIPGEAVIMVYEKVVDVATVKELDSATGKYRYKVVKETESDVNRQTLVSGTSSVIVPPSAALDLPEVNVYDTADLENEYITVTRKSFHSQSKDLTVSWLVDLGDGKGYQELTQSGNDWLLNGQVLLKNTVPPKMENGQAKGEWRIKKSDIKTCTKGIPDGNIALRIQEKVTETLDKQEVVNDFSARTIYFRRDITPPSAQTVEVKTQITTDNWNTFTTQDYEASNYLDVTKNDRRIAINVSGSVDGQGHVAGYGYYFYDYDGNNNISKVYKLENGALKEISGATAKDKIKAAVGWNPATQKGDSVLPAAGGTIYIDGKVKAPTPTCSLNIAIFAFDNQGYTVQSEINKLPKDNVTLANETSRTKIENIKLASFVPMPTEIKVLNTLGEEIAYVNNVGGFKGGVKDTQSRDDKKATNGNATIEFTPRQGWFTLNGDKDPEYVENPPADADTNTEYQKTHAKYYVDTSKHADLTNKAQIQYTVEKQNSGGQYQIYQYQGVTYQDLVIEATSKITITENGKYKVTAKVVNGSKAYSDTREVEFEIDKNPPSGMRVTFRDNNTAQPYVEGEWAKNVTMTVTGATDNENKAGSYYRYSLDNGATWTNGGMGLADISYTFDTTGEYNIRILAVDNAGNESSAITGRVRIDAEPPVMSPPTITASSDNQVLYSHYVISILESQGGKVLALENDIPQELDTEITVPVHGNQAFLITPEQGYYLQSVTVGSRTYAPEELTANGDGSYRLELENVMENAQLSAVFTQSPAVLQSYMAASRGSFESYRNTGGQEPVLAAGAVHKIILDNSDIYGEVKSSKTEVEDGGSVMLTFRALSSSYQLDTATINRGGQEEEIHPTQTNIAGVYEYTVDNITTDITVKATFKERVTHTLTLSWNADSGQASLAGDATPDTQQWGQATYTFHSEEALTLSFTPQEGYTVSDLTINEDSLGGVADGTISIPSEYTNGDITAKVTFAVDTQKATNNLILEIPQVGGTVQPTGEPTGDDGYTYTLTVPHGSSKTFRIIPQAGYTPSVTLRTYDPRTQEWKEQSTPPPVKESDGSYSYTLTNIVENTNKLTFAFTQNMWSVTTKVSSLSATGAASSVVGGSLTVTGTNQEEVALGAVPEGTELIFDIAPKEGWRIGSVYVNGEDYGNRRGFTIPSVAKNYVVEVTFIERAFQTVESSHTLSVTANNISDNHQSLHPTNTYRFRLTDGDNGSVIQDWSDWQASPSFTYTSLEPDKNYRVTVQAQDAAGNVSSGDSNDRNSSTRCTKANYPTALSLDTLEDENSSNKTAVMVVDPNGNPADTQYKVFLSSSPAMTKRSEADVGTEDGWTTLSAGNEIYIYNLVPGQRYYMQVVARNKENMSNEANDKNVVNILLSPIAPPENSLYFEEQTGPGQPITLHWNKEGEGDILGFEIYRDGSLIASCGADQTSYVDNSAIWGDSLYVYSYAYVNTAGTGSRRSAVSQQYYEASQTGGEDKAKLDALAQELCPEDAPYTETMTYPVFPAGIRKDEATALTEDENSGRARYYITTGSGTATRNQKYEVGIQAYEKNDDGSYTPVAGWDWKNYLTTTTTVDSRGAMAQWSNLNINYEYRIFVNKVMTTGPRVTSGNSITDGYDGSTGGLEGSFGKVCTVDKNGYSFTFTNQRALALLDHPQQAVAWSSADEADSYAAPGGWDAAIGDYIKFNKSPQIVADDNPLAGNDEDKLVEYNGQPAIILNQGGGDMTFKVGVKVWDPDGAEDKNFPSFKITGTISGVTGTVEETVTEVGESKENASTYYILFDAKNLATGIYTDMTIAVSDGGTKKSLDISLPVIVNRTLPTIKATDSGAVRQIEVGRNYGKTSTYEIVTSVSKAAGCTDEDMRIISLNAMKDEFNRLFGSNTASGIKAAVNGNTGSARENAKLVMGEAAYNAAMADQSFSDEETNQLIDSVTPPLQGWFSITQQDYQTAVDAGNSSQVEADTVGGANRYWAKTEYALANDLCAFLVRQDNGDIVVRGDINKLYTVRLTASYGENSSSSLVSFRTRDKLTVKVLSSKLWAWQEVSNTEFKAYKENSKTIGDIYEAFKTSYSTAPWDQDAAFTKDTKAYLPESATGDEVGTTYKVFKLVDEKIKVLSTVITANVEITTGIYPNINNAYALLTTDPSFKPSSKEDEENPDKVVEKKQILTTMGYPELTSNENGDPTKYGITIRGLKKDTTYYMWIAYDKTEPETGETTRVYLQDYVAVTTPGDYNTATYSFENVYDSHKEKEDTDGVGYALNYEVARDGEEGPVGTLKADIRYYMADQYGKLITDESGNEIELTGEALEAAKKTLTITTPTLTFGSNEIGNKTLQLKLFDTNLAQGHMLARVTLTVDPENSTGYNYISNNGGTLEIFIQDDDSPITAYIGGLDEVKGLSEIERESTQKPGKYYAYNFAGISNSQLTPETLSLALRNEDVGALSSISVELYESDQTTVSKSFSLTQALTKDNLLSNSDELSATDRAYFGVSANNDLADGVYSGWIKVSWDLMEEEDTLWVRLYQVAYQSTLKGYVYFGVDKPTAVSTAFIGKSTVEIYERPVKNSDPITNLLYTTETNDEGYYEIPNILNNKKYCIVIKRPGFLTVDNWAMNRESWTRNGTSGEFELSIRLIGGDVNGDQKIDLTDYNLLANYYGATYDVKNPTEEDLPLMRCDYNADGAVNALDRMLIYGNQGKTQAVYMGQTPVAVE